MLPDCNLNIPAFEWDAKILLTANDFNSFDTWLKRFVTYWKTADSRQSTGKLTQQDIDQIKNYIRPKFESIPSLSTQLN